ncbi:hypothetical protein GGR54DRAFT_91300 [Hypoxylon sp. NC1633]|nr:hypothetical protein GGR54DRAFT_91300 [Hypoxylon sp. NC1633]
MASVPYELIGASKPFRFRVGPEKKEFMMHAELVAGMSKPLQALVKGDWEEGKTGLAEMPELDVGTFVQFCEYAYTGDYKPAPPEVKIGDSFDQTPESPEPLPYDAEPPPPEESEEPVGYEQEDPWGSVLRPKKKKGQNKNVATILWQQFQAGVGQEPDGRAKEYPNTDASADYSEVLLSHARLYAFADCYAIDALAGLCVRKLHRMLKVFDLHGGARVPDVAQLIDYTYKNTANREGRPDALRALLATYAACKIEDLWPNVYFQDVLESGEVSKAILGQVLTRLN